MRSSLCKDIVQTFRKVSQGNEQKLKLLWNRVNAPLLLYPLSQRRCIHYPNPYDAAKWTLIER